MEMKKIQIKNIETDPNQPRKYINEAKTKELAESIRQNGLIEPIMVEKTNKNGKYQIVVGERRFLAHKLLGLKTIDCIIKKFKKTDNRLAIQLIENIQREDLKPVEKQAALDSLLKETGWKKGELAENIGKSNTVVSMLLSLKNLDEQIRKESVSMDCSMTLLYELSKKSKEDQLKEWEKIKSGETTSREQLKEPKDKPAKEPKEKPAKEKELEQEIAEKFEEEGILEKPKKDPAKRQIIDYDITKDTKYAKELVPRVLKALPEISKKIEKDPLRVFDFFNQRWLDDIS